MDKIVKNPPQVDKLGGWLLKFLLKGGYKNVVSRLLGKNGEHLEVSCLLKHSTLKNVFAFPKRVDLNTISVDQIVTNLPEPDKNGEKLMFAQEWFEGITMFLTFLYFFFVFPHLR